MPPIDEQFQQQRNRVTSPAIPGAPFSVILWRDLFVMIDDGRGRPKDYERAADAVIARSKGYPDGIGCITIIPPTAKPPPDDSRRAINAALERMERLKSLCWLVEGRGFEAAMVRGVLTGIRMFGKHRYPTTVGSSLQQSLAWSLVHLGGGTARLTDVPLAASVIMQERLVGGIVEAD